MARFEPRWQRGTRERVIFDIPATDLLIGDIATLGRQHLKQHTVVIEGQPVCRTVISIDSEKSRAAAAEGNARCLAHRRPRLHHHPARYAVD
jgi:hypothetical protein